MGSRVPWGKPDGLSPLRVGATQPPQPDARTDHRSLVVHPTPAEQPSQEPKPTKASAQHQHQSQKPTKPLAQRRHQPWKWRGGLAKCWHRQQERGFLGGEG